MNQFQSKCREALDEVFAEVGVAPHHELLDYDEETAPVDEGRARFLRTQAIHDGRLYDLYSYEGEAGAQIENNWYLFERRVFESEGAIVAALAHFTRVCLEGGTPVDAYRSARARKETS